MLIAWEVTRSCMLACKHCRAAAQRTPYPDELTTDECFALLDNIASFAKPIIILTGGEPMLRPDIYDIAKYAGGLGMRVVMAPCGALIDDESAAKILDSGIRHISISLDGATAESHDEFRGVAGAFESSLRGIEAAKRAGLSFQVNTTITQDNLDEVEAILDLSVELGASVFNPFLLVPTGRGKELADREISPEQYEQTLHWLAGQQSRGDIRIRVTCAPHYQRVIRQLGVRGDSAHQPKGCMGGQSFAFISHRGKVQICGFLDTEAGDLREENLDFKKIWDTSELFGQVRDLSGYHGRCGRCEFARVCGGCRARAFAVTGDYLADDPFCLYEPKRRANTPSPGDGLGDIDKRILSIIQTDFPVEGLPFKALGERTGVSEEQAIEAVGGLLASGMVRRLGAVFDSRLLGYFSTLVAARIPPARIAQVAEMVSALPGVTHNYRRENVYNLWFTLTAESQQRLDEIIEDLKVHTGIDEFYSLPALTVYKIRVSFDLGDRPVAPPAPHAPAGSRAARIDEGRKKLVRVLQESLPLVRRPFGRIAQQLGCPAGRLIEQVNDWLAAGVIRRFGAVVDHRMLGFKANGMAVFRVGPDRIDEVGRRLAERPEISHCYRRPALPGFDYGLFAMVHGRSRDRVRRLVAEMAEKLGLADACEILFSATEYKKVSMKYFSEPGRQMA